jgi:pimeloyl-ACP methyl ester carboxylesterase
MESKSITYRHKNICYRLYGSGSPVILLHGFGEDGRSWETQAEALSNEYLFIVPDLPGTGKSAEAFDAEDEWTMEKFAMVVKTIAQQEQLNSFSLIGHSMGGYITLAFMELYPNMLNGAGLLHSTSYADNEEKIAARKKGIASIKNHGANLFLEQLIPNLYGDPFKALHPEEINMHIEATKGFSEASLISYYEAMINRPDRRHVLSSFHKPLLFIMGAEDKAVNLPDSLAQCHLPEECHVILLQESGHMGMREEARKTTTAIKEFLRRINEN